ncbi:MAG: phosphonate metabolism transcriptional regulator PhnF [Paracoccaceae bacterium]
MTGSVQGRAQPLWKRIRETLLDEINAGQYPPGSKLPTEAALSQRFGVNRHTVRRALETLQEEGRIHVRRGSGAFVTQGRFDYAIGLRTRLTDNLKARGMASSRRILRVERLSAELRDAANLEIDVGDPVIVREAVGEADGVPITYARTCFPEARLPGVFDALIACESISEALQRIGIADYHRKWTRLTAERPGAFLARHLQMPDIHPVLHSESVNVSPDGQLVEYGNTWFCSDRVQIVVDNASFHRDTLLTAEPAR